jgi:hypothetical protein
MVEGVEPALVLKGQVGRVETVLGSGVCRRLGQEGCAIEVGVPGDRARRSCRRGDKGRSGGEEGLSRAGLGRGEPGLVWRLSQSTRPTYKFQTPDRGLRYGDLENDKSSCRSSVWLGQIGKIGEWRNPPGEETLEPRLGRRGGERPARASEGKE